MTVWSEFRRDFILRIVFRAIEGNKIPVTSTQLPNTRLLPFLGWLRALPNSKDNKIWLRGHLFTVFSPEANKIMNLLGCSLLLVHSTHLLRQASSVLGYDVLYFIVTSVHIWGRGWGNRFLRFLFG